MDQTTFLILNVVVAGGAFWFFGRKQRQRVELNCEGVILVFEKRAIHHVIPTAAPTNLEVRTEEVATEEE